MPENGMPGPVCDLSSVRESVCIHTKKIFDSCRDKDCIEDLRFYPTEAALEVLNTSQIIKGGCAGVIEIGPKLSGEGIALTGVYADLQTVVLLLKAAGGRIAACVVPGHAAHRN